LTPLALVITRWHFSAWVF